MTLLFIIPVINIPNLIYRPLVLRNAPTIEGMIVAAAIRNEIDPDLAIKLAWRESNLRPEVIGHNRHSTDRGVMQINDKAVPRAAEMSTAENIETGVGILAKWLRQCKGDKACAVQAYGLGHLPKSRSNKGEVWH